MIMKLSWVYILSCADGSYYVGSTTDLTARLAKHYSGAYCGYTSSRRPVELVYSQKFGDVNEAVRAERQIKGWTRAEKAALIERDFDLLHALARSEESKKSRV
jgi:predicted GIY-YIG superfamily endonuclease